MDIKAAAQAQMRLAVARETADSRGISRLRKSDVTACIPTREQMTPCPGETGAEVATRLALEERHRRNLENWRASGVSKRHRQAVEGGLSLESWPIEQQAAVTRAIELVRKGGMVALLGPFGTGKTQLAAWLCYGVCVSMGRPSRYYRFADLLAEARKEAYSDGGSDAEVVKRLSRLGLLVLDELHYRRWTADESLWLSRILDHRYGEVAPTVVIANQTPEEFQKAMDPAVIDRMRECGAVVELTGSSRRGQ